MKTKVWLLLAPLLGAAVGAAHAQKIGDVDTAFQWIGPDH
jgi:CreA protein